MLRPSLFVAGVLSLAATDLAAQSVVASRPVITHEGARVAIAASVARAREMNRTVVIAVLDAGSNLVALERMDGAPTASVDVALAKGRSATGFGFPTANWEEWTRGEHVLLGLPVAIPIAGGVPIRVNDVVVGAVAVSGANSTEDAQIAQAGVDAVVAAAN